MALNILIADDASIFRNFIKSAINMVDIDANFIETSDGRSLFAMYEQNVPEVTIIDAMLPNINVLNFLKKILDIHPIASIIVFVDSTNHDFVKDAKAIGIEEVLFKTIGQFSLGTIIKKMISKKASKVVELEQKSQHHLTNALTLTTLNKSASNSQYVKLTNATIQRRIKNIEEMQRLGGSFDSTIKKLYDKNNDEQNQELDKSNAKSQTMTVQKSQSFFMRELSNESLIGLLRDKIKEIKANKVELEDVNKRLSKTISELQESKLELIVQKEHLEEQVQIQTKALLKSEKLAIVGELSARIAHDMRNPLSVVKNTLEILKFSLVDRLSTSELEQWKRLDRGLYRMSHQIDDVMDFIKQRPLQKTKAKVSTLLSDVLERITVPDNIEIHLPQIDCDVFWDTERMEAVFSNIILNSIQAIDGNPGSINIIISNESISSKFIMIEVQDTGLGIPEDIGYRIFDPLFTTKQIGTGLGLTGCKRIIEAHGGTIIFKSKVGTGTIFFIKLPKGSEWNELEASKASTHQTNGILPPKLID